MRDANRHRLAVVSGVAVFCSLLWLVYWNFQVVAGSGDGAYTYLAHVHAAQARAWGVTAMHTSGPLGWLRFPIYVPETFALLVAGQVFTALAAAALLVMVFLRRAEGWIVPLLTAVAVPWELSRSDDAIFYFTLSAWVLAASRTGRVRAWAGAVGTVFAALAFLIKGSLMLPIVGAAALLAVVCVMRRRVPWQLPLLGAAVAGLNLLAGGTLATLGDHVRHVLSSIDGYGESFSLTGDLGEVLIAFACLAAIMLFVAHVEWHARRWAGMGIALALGIVLWCAFKSSFVRHDAVHASRALNCFMPLLLCCFAAEYRRAAGWLSWNAYGGTRFGRGARAALFAAIAVAGIAIASRAAGVPHWWQPAAARSAALASLLARGTEPLKRRHDDNLQSIRKRFPLPDEVTDDVATYGTLQTPAQAWGLRGVQMPFIAHYELWAPYAIRRTVDFLQSPAAPRYIIRTASVSGAPAEIALARNYEQIADGPLTVLRRRTNPLQVRMERVLAAEAVWGEPIELPTADEGALVMCYTYTPTLLNRLVSFVYQPPQVLAVLHSGSERPARIRLNRLLGKEGVVLAARTDGDWDGNFRRLHAQRHPLLTAAAGPLSKPDRLLTAVSLEAKLLETHDATRYFLPTVQLEVFRVRFEAE